MKPTTIVLLTLLPLPANAQDGGRIFHDAAGRVTGSARTDANGVTTFHDRAGRVTGTARTDSKQRDHVPRRQRASQVRSGDEGQWLSTNPSIGATSEWFTPPEYFDGLELRPLTGENRGSSPLGSANDFSELSQLRLPPFARSPTFLQWTVLHTVPINLNQALR